MTASNEDIQAILNGCDGVTPGPWLSAYWPGSGSTGPDVGILQGPQMVQRDKSLFHTPADAAHIARLSPESVHSLLTELLELRQRRDGMLPVHPMASFETGLAPGLYTIHWKDEGSSQASIGMKPDGSRWIAPTNWVGPSTDSGADFWDRIERAEPVASSFTQGYERGREDAAKLADEAAQDCERAFVGFASSLNASSYMQGRTKSVVTAIRALPIPQAPGEKRWSVLGVSRDGENPQAISVSFSRPLHDDELRALHDSIRETGRAEPRSAFEAVRALIKPNSILEASEVQLDQFTRKQVFNALTYLTRTGELAHIGYGRYQSPPSDAAHTSLKDHRT